MKHILKCISVFGIIVSICFFFINIVHATTYYVSPTGDDNNSGSIDYPFKTIQKAANVVNPGDTAIVKDGVYTRSGYPHLVYLTGSGTAQNWITFKAENTLGAIMDGEYQDDSVFSNNSDYGFYTAGNYVRFEDFEIRNFRKGGFFITSAIHDIYLYRNKIHDIGRYKIPCSDPDYAYSHKGLYASTTASYLTIDSNTFYNIGRPEGSTCDYDPVPTCCDASHSDATCPQESHVDYNSDHAIYLKSHYNTIINNIFYNNKSGWQIQLDSAGNVTIANNTFYGANPARDGHIILVGYPHDIVIQNNISYGPTTHMNQAIDANDTNVVIKNNLVYGATLPASACTYATCSDNIVGSDPKFVSLPDYNFHIRYDSPAINEGSTVSGRTVDKDGNSIIGDPDLGAYEYYASSSSYDRDAQFSANSAFAASAIKLFEPPIVWWKMDETSGSSAYDSSGNNVTATLYNDAAFVAGRIANAMFHDGADSYASASGSIMSGLTSFSITAWIYPDTFGESTEGTIFSQETGAGWNEKRFRMYNSAIDGGVYDTVRSTVRVTRSVQGSIVQDVWQHVAYVYDNPTQYGKLYINGTEVSSYAYQEDCDALRMTTDDLNVGNRPSGDRAFNGKIDDLRIYDRVLLPSEILTIYQEFSNPVIAMTTTAALPESGLLDFQSNIEVDISSGMETEESICACSQIMNRLMQRITATRNMEASLGVLTNPEFSCCSADLKQEILRRFKQKILIEMPELFSKRRTYDSVPKSVSRRR